MKIDESPYSIIYYLCPECNRYFEDGVTCPHCENSYQNLNPTYFAEFVFLSSKNSKVTVRAKGDVLDIVMGMTAKDFIKLQNYFSKQTLSSFVQRYFKGSTFVLKRIENNANQMRLPNGSSFTFMVWLSMQSSLSQSLLLSIIFSS